jgi:hypothetical protein
MTSTTRIRSIAAVAVTAALLLASAIGCSSGSSQNKAGANATSAAGSDQQQQLKFAQCMRDHGVDMPDPGSGGLTGVAPSGGAPGTLSVSGDPNAVNLNPSAGNSAFQACRHFLPNGGQVQPPSAAQLTQELKFAQCMRAHGVDMPDPDPSGQLQGIPVPSGNPSDSFKKLDDANRACAAYNGQGGQ